MAHVITVSGRWADTLQVAREVESGEVISNSSAKTIASWYATLDSALYKLAHGVPVNTLRVGYEITDLAREYQRNPDSGSAGDVARLTALRDWLSAQTRAYYTRAREEAGLRLTPRGLVRL